QLSVFKTRQVEHLLDQARQLIALRDNVGDSAVADRVQALIVGLFQLQYFCEAHDRGDRSAQFVASEREKGVLFLFDHFLGGNITEDDNCPGDGPPFIVQWRAGTQHYQRVAIRFYHGCFLTAGGFSEEGVYDHEIPWQRLSNMHVIQWVAPSMLMER